MKDETKHKKNKLWALQRGTITACAPLGAFWGHVGPSSSLLNSSWMEAVQRNVAVIKNALNSHHVLVIVIVVVVHGVALGHPAAAAASAHPFVPSAPGTAAATPI